jgi:phenylalanyl-tRNA synthetase beta chain
MKISRKWLDRLVDVSDIETSVIADTLTNSGHEVEGIEPLIIGTNLVIGQVLECEPLPESDHLSVCQVDVKEEVLQIVCGAPNVAKGQKVIVALVGAELADFTIKETTIRGVESKGMICSLKELSLNEKFIPEESLEGIEVLGDDALVGDDPINYLGLDDEILDIKQTPNRSDFMSMDAIAFEVAGIFERELFSRPTFENPNQGHKTKFKVNSTTDNCPLFWAKVIRNVEIKESPTWIKQALRGSGMHPINNIVDISNLVMLETGQPNHLYDYRFFDQHEITVIDDYEGTQVALDGEEYELKAGDTVISSAGLPIGIGGIKGLGNSMIKDDTSSIVVEIASFDPIAIRNTSKRLGLFTDASTRYVKPMDPLAPQKALERICYYLVEYGGATVDDFEETVKYDVTTEYEAHTVSVSLKEVNDLLGTDIVLEDVIDVFKRLGLAPKMIGDRISCKIPSFRRDLWIKEDLIEEVIRVLGYDLIESTSPFLELTESVPLSNEQIIVRSIENKLASLGLNQVMTYTLVNHKKIKGDDPIELLSPLSENRQYVRDQITPSLLEMLQYNLDHKNQDEVYFEVSQVYTKDKSSWHLGIIGSGSLRGDHWLHQQVENNFYTMKGLIETLLVSLGINENRLGYRSIENTAVYHPYQSASLTLDNKVIGQFGVVHPSLNIKKAMLAEIDLTNVFEAKKAKTRFTPLQKYPTVERDLAVVIKDDIKSDELIRSIKKAGRPYITEVSVFDVFVLEGNQKSIALSLKFESKDKTLTDAEITKSIDLIVESLEKDHGALLRSS